MRWSFLVIGCLLVGTVAFSGAAIAGDTPGLLFFETDETEVSPGDTVTVNAEVRVITVTDDESVKSIEYTIAYDPEILSVDEVEQGPWLRGGEETDVPFETSVDDEEGRLTVSQTRAPPAGGVTGEGTTAVVTFELAEDAPSVNATLRYTDPDIQMLGYDYPLGTMNSKETLYVNGGGEERDPLADDESDDGPEIITPETEEETSESDRDTESVETDPEPEPELEDQSGFGIGVALVALIAAIGLYRQTT